MSARMTLVVASIVVPALAEASPLTVSPGDGAFRRVTAVGGTISGADLSSSIVRRGTQNQSLLAIATQAAGAVPTTMANVPNGWLQLGTDGMVPASRLPAAFSSSSALQVAALGQPNGPAQLDSLGAISSALAGAGGNSNMRPLSAHFSDTLNAADYGVLCNGSTDDTAALNKAFSAYQARGRATRMVLPSGVCVFSAEIDVNVSSSLMLSGAGFSGTRLSLTAQTNGMVFTLSNASDLTIQGLRISKTVGANPSGVAYANTALSIAPASNATANGGQVTLADIGVMGESENPTVGWAAGIKLVDLHTPSLYNVKIFQPPALTGTTNAALMAAPEPGQTSGTTPAGLASLVGDGIYFGGAGDFLVDISLVNCLVDGGIVGFEVGPNVQGVYGVNKRAVYNDYGLRGEANGSLAELVNWSNGLFNNVVAGVYLNAINENAISNNLFLHDEGGGPGWNAIWLRNQGWSTITGNNVLGLYSGSHESENGIQLTADSSGGASGQPNTVSANTIQAIQGVCVNVDQNTSSTAINGNAMHYCGGSYMWNHSASGASIGNFMDGRTSIHEDGLGNIALGGSVAAGSLALTGNASVAGALLRSSANVAGAGTGQTTATPLTRDYDVITACSSGAGVSLPASSAGAMVKVMNRSGASCLVYPKASDTIEHGQAAAPTSIASGADIEFVSVGTGNWVQ